MNLFMQHTTKYIKLISRKPLSINRQNKVDNKKII